MKLNYLLLLTLLLPTTFLFAQKPCVPDGSLLVPGVTLPNDIPCVTQNIIYDEVVQFKNFNQVFLDTLTFTLDSIRIDSINNLPCGLHWESDKPNNIYTTLEDGCIRVSGTTFDPIGQYRVDVWATIASAELGSVWIGPVNSSDFDLITFYTRIIAETAPCLPIDSTLTDLEATCNGALPLQAFIGPDTTICMDQSIDLEVTVEDGSGLYTYEWTPTNGLSCMDCSNPNADPDSSTTYTVLVTDLVTGNTAETVIAVTIIDCNESIWEHANFRPLLLYPNPNNGSFVINTNAWKGLSAEMEISDLRGLVIYSGILDLNKNKSVFNLNTISKGAYFIKLQNRHHVSTGQIIIH